MLTQRSSLIYILLALLLGLAAAYLAQRWAEHQWTRARQEAAGDAGFVVVANREIRFGTKIDAADLKLASWPVASMPSGAFGAVADVSGKVSKYDILPGEPVLAPRVSATDSPLLASLIEPNKRAVSVRVDDVVGVAGFLLPGSHVDVVASRHLEQDRYETHTVLQNLKVLAVDQTASVGGEDKPVVVRAVTLETDPREAEVLVQATREGSVQLALRNPGDSSVAVTQTEPVRHVTRAAKSAAPSLTAIRGTQVSPAP